MADYNDDLNYPDPFYISDIETYELLYVNEAGRRLFKVPLDADLDGVACYEFLQGRHDPCPFCTNHLLSVDKSYVWEFTNPLTKHRHLLNDRLINWGGKLVRLEVGFDLTDQKEEGMRFRNLHKNEQIILEIANDLYRATDPQRASDSMLERLGAELHAERAYIFSAHNSLFDNTYEWCAEGVAPEIGNLQGIDYANFSRWLDLFGRNECVLIEDLSLLKGTIDDFEYETLAQQGIVTLVVSPIERDGELVGFLGLDNPPVELIRDIAPLLRTLCYFYSMTLQRIENERQLVTMSYHDSLTGLYNRNRYNEDVRALEKLARPFGAIFLDVNGMKEINDRGGHAEGDRLLQMCSETMRRVLGGAARIYRVGGDEFVATVVDTDEEGFRALVDGLQRAFAETPSCNVAIGAQWTARSDEIDRALFDADEAMYRDKRRFYRSKYTSDLAGARHPRSGRYHEAGSGAPSESFERGASFMNVLGFGFARQLMDEDFSVIASNDLYAALVGDDAASRRAVGALASRAFEAGERSFCGPVRVSRRGEPAWVEVIGTFAEEAVEGTPVVCVAYIDLEDALATIAAAE
ncbi:sensor domain-containing diguanylate cyclase [Eggerthella sp. NSJ-70]|uniref:Sensor domain-containing diguanylate cyclase n=1 Tax=Eggerthella hominis TaxID=2763043 RepID=A0ABR7BRS4_9ACTN|nr:sensor domain-containing diguanylate cyclase [Eggerthella hominis]MBC5584321.1 sensor domain-containing diguanylate cyclase [Eggerthella hominis]